MKPRRVFRVAAAGKMVRLVLHDEETGEPIAELAVVRKRYRPGLADGFLQLIDGHESASPPTSPRGHAKAFRRAFRGFLRLE